MKRTNSGSRGSAQGLDVPEPALQLVPTREI
jgi:hypothetical protein